MTFCGIRNDNNYLQQSIYSTILQFTNVIKCRCTHGLCHNILTFCQLSR